VRDEIGAPAVAGVRRGGAVFAFVGELEAGLVVELVGPAIGVRGADQVVKIVLRLPAERAGADQARGDFEGVEPADRPRAGGENPRCAVDLERRAGVEPRGVGAVAGQIGRRVGVGRGVEILTEREAELVVAARRHELAEGAGELLERGRHRLIGETLQVGGEEGEFETVGVVAIGAGEIFVVLRVESDGPEAEPRRRQVAQRQHFGAGGGEGVDAEKNGEEEFHAHPAGAGKARH